MTFLLYNVNNKKKQNGKHETHKKKRLQKDNFLLLAHKHNKSFFVVRHVGASDLA